MKKSISRSGGRLRGLVAGFIATVFVAWSLSTKVGAVASDLDPTFGNGGKITYDFGGSEWATAVVIQPDGKIVLAGTSFEEGTDEDFTVLRLNRDGSLDASFGNNGKATADFSAYKTFLFNFDDECLDMALQPDGKIITVGWTWIQYPTKLSFAVARFNSNGTLDTSFSGDGKVVTDFSDVFCFARSVAVQPDGKIVVAGDSATVNAASYDDFALVRYNSDGSLDSSFGSGGRVKSDFHNNSEYINRIRIQPDGKIVAAGITYTGIANFALARYKTDGTLDEAFGSEGKVITQFFDTTCEAFDLALQSDGKIVVAGRAVRGPFHIAIARYNSDGRLDSTFGVGGKVFSSLSLEEWANAVAIQSNGKILVAGPIFIGGFNEEGDLVGSFDFVLVRYNIDGSFDTNFGTGGVVSTEFMGGNDEASAIAIEPSGRIIVGGYAKHSGTNNQDFAVARYIGDPVFDLCIQDDSAGNLLQINSNNGEYLFTNCSGFTIGGTGTLTKKGNSMTLVHNASDRRVTAQIDTTQGKATTSIQLFSPSRIFTIIDRNTANNTCACK